ncbi:alginate O-acetyltransferase [Haloferula helveola]|uniref:Alginate O-acetyltransferase n=1 Tax=Haloferula helveola TaxID=490095 RepID=A0ABN6H3U2_9BACT|nr:alginate O-acetyltransferase [Haloferula helveola]
MFFHSWEFLILLVATAVAYYLPVVCGRRRVWQVSLLLIASAVFYAWENPKLLLLLGVSCVINAVAVERILFWKSKVASSRREGTEKEADALEQDAPSARERHLEHRARRWLVGTVAANLGLLAFFKYAGFIAGWLPEGWMGKSMLEWLRGIPLPVGISFYTFQGISLVVDTWRRDISPHSMAMIRRRGRDRPASIRDLSFYISFFPQLVAGPIVKAHDFLDQIGAKRWGDIDWITVRRGLVTGYFLKIFVADNLAEQTGVLALGADKVEGMSTVVSMSLLYGYSLQIFADFAGYSLIAIGLGALFGYKLPPNFNFPYLSTSITEFWRRWHLSLSSWLRDYLYIPLGGNRKGGGRTYFNLFLVMFLGGLWHGAAWKFALWGSLHGVFLAAERLVQRGAKSGEQRLNPRKSSRLRSLFSKLFACSKWFLTFHLVTLLWLTFMMPDLESIGAFFHAAGSLRFGFSGPPVFALAFYGTTVVAYHAWGWLSEHRDVLARKLARSPLEPLCHSLMVFLVVTNPGAPRGFIYFQF